MAGSTNSFIRRDVWSLAADDPIVTGYARAVAVMKERPVDDPTSWTYQAAIHGTLAKPNKALWNQCQHGTWFFPPWHRMFLLRFEEIARKIVIEGGGPADWALPYWNYGLDGKYATIPLAFRKPQLSNGEPNPLYVAARAPGINSGASLPPSATSAAKALARPHFIGAAEFGGGITKFSHFPHSFGRLEENPHNIVHVEVGGPRGLMTSPETAALDPIFWLHHSNIDRLWTVWNAAGGADPGETRWQRQSFELFDVDGSRVAMRCEAVLDTTRLGYTYGGGAPTRHAVASLAATPAPPTPALPVNTEKPQLVGATSKTYVLVGEPLDLAVTIDAEAAGKLLPGQHVYLNIEEIKGERNPGVNYAVYVELPPDPAPEIEAAHQVGNLAFFGIEGASDPRGDEHPHGLRFSVDITAIAQGLASRGEWAGHQLGVEFRPLGLTPPEVPDPADLVQAASHPDTPVEIGRVSIFYDA
jgi:tyrosinase